MSHIEELMPIVNNTMGLPELVNAFESVSLPHTGDEDYDVLYEYGNFDFTGTEKFYFSLALQWPSDDEEYIQLHMDAIYPVMKICDDMGDSLWASEFDTYQDFFDAIRNHEIYKHLTQNDIPYQKLEISEEET